MPRLTRGLLYPRKVRMGVQNGNFKHGGWSRHLTPEERQRCEADEILYLKEYPYLREPVALDMLKEALVLKNAIIPRLEDKVLDPNTALEDTMKIDKLLDVRQRTLVLLFSRLGITYTSRTHRKEPRKVRTPLELISEGDK